MYTADNPSVRIPTSDGLRTITLDCVVDTGTQITAMGRNHAELMGINCSMLSQTTTSLSCLSGEEITPIGSFYATVTGIRKEEGGKKRTITTKEIVYVFEKTPTPYISRSVLITLGVIKEKMEVAL